MWSPLSKNPTFGQFLIFGFLVQAASNVQDESGTSKKFGFVSFERHEDAEKCVNELNGKEFGDRKLYCGRAQKKAERQAELKNKFEKLKQERIQRYQGVNLYVKNLDDSITDDILREHFSQFGTITSAKVGFRSLCVNSVILSVFCPQCFTMSKRSIGMVTNCQQKHP